MKIFLRVIRICITVPVFLLSAVSVFAGEPGRDTLRVMSYNILRDVWAKPTDPAWSNRCGGVVEIIKKWDPDIVGLQEESPAMVSDLLDRLDGYAYMFPVPINGGGILFKYRMLQPQDTTRRITTDGKWITEVLFSGADGRKFYYYNLHLSPFEEWKRMMAVETLGHMMAERRQKDIPLIITGDFNALDTSEPIKRLTSTNNPWMVRDVFSVLNIEKKNCITADAYGTHGHGPEFRIDYVMFNGAVRPLAYNVVQDKPQGLFPSDHLPVLVDFDLRPAAGRP